MGLMPAISVHAHTHDDRRQFVMHKAAISLAQPSHVPLTTAGTHARGRGWTTCASIGDGITHKREKGNPRSPTFNPRRSKPRVRKIRSGQSGRTHSCALAPGVTLQVTYATTTTGRFARRVRETSPHLREQRLGRRPVSVDVVKWENTLGLASRLLGLGKTTRTLFAFSFFCTFSLGGFLTAHTLAALQLNCTLVLSAVATLCTLTKPAFLSTMILSVLFLYTLPESRFICTIAHTHVQQ